jgi:hypothetical protein
MDFKSLACSLSLILVSTIAQAKIYTPNCPKEIKSIEHVNVSQNDWETIADIPHNFLSGISFYSGHPKDMASLKPHFINKKTAKWTFSKKQTIYIACQYNQTGIKLTQPLPKNTTECTVHFNPTVMGNNGFIPETIRCVK